MTTAAQTNIWATAPGQHPRVTLFHYPASDGHPRAALVVCPGGSYFWHAMRTEGHGVGEWLAANGIAAFVLEYRTATMPAFVTHYRLVARGNRYPDPQDDLRQTLRLLRSNAAEYGISGLPIGAMGFSAGGHLVMSATELFDKGDRPDFVAALYPVVTMTAPSTHRRSRRGLLGDNRTGDRQLCNLLSLEQHVQTDCPPVFLANCKDDPVVDYRNSELLDSALTAKGIPHVYHQYATGGHGFGASDDKGSEESRQWRTQFLEWLQGILRSNGI